MRRCPAAAGVGELELGRLRPGGTGNQVQVTSTGNGAQPQRPRQLQIERVLFLGPEVLLSHHVGHPERAADAVDQAFRLANPVDHDLSYKINSPIRPIALQVLQLDHPLNGLFRLCNTAHRQR